MKPVWIVDDDKSIRWVLEKTLAREQLPFRSFASASEALALIERGAPMPQVLISDVRMPGESPVTALAWRPDGGRLAFGCEDGAAGVLNFEPATG